jgi:cell wall-associated NlpC family hydrolase
VTARRTALHDAPRGEVLRELAAGTRVRVTGAIERRFRPVAVPGQRLRGWVRAADLTPIERPPAGGSPNGGDGDGDAGPAAGPGPGADGGDVGARIAAEAGKYLGFPYQLGTRGPHSFDCSGLVHWVVKQVTGEPISPDSHAQFNLGTPIGAGRLRAGDLLFYDTMNGHEVREGNTASHVGIFVAPGRMVNALNPELGVRESDPFSPYFDPRYIGARRLF